MHIKTRVDLKKYITLSLISTLISSALLWDFTVSCVVFLVYFATLINHACLIEIVEDLSEASKDKHLRRSAEPLDKFKIMQLTFVKIVVLIGALSLGVLFVGNKIIIPLINYVIIIFILGLSLKTRKL